MKDSKHGLVLGAIAFIDSYRKNGAFPKYLHKKVDVDLVQRRILNDIATMKAATQQKPK